MPIKFLEFTTLEERQRLYYNGSHCPYCGEETEYVDSIRVHRESFGMVYWCRSCHAWVGTHNNSDQSYGFVAKSTLRDLRHQAHLAFDPLWQKKSQISGVTKRAAQAAARKWLSGQLGTDIVETHIGMFDNEQCKKVIALCKPFHLTAEQLKEKELEFEEMIETIHFYSNRGYYTIKEFTVGGMCQLELKRPDGKTLFYNPRKKIGRWSNRKHPIPIADIEAFIIKHFNTKKNEKNIAPNTPDIVPTPYYSGST